MSTPTPAPTVVGWVTMDDTLPAWTDHVTRPMLVDRLEAAYEQCVEYMPFSTDPVPAGETPPARLRLAQLMQARGLIRSEAAAANDSLGLDGIGGVTVFPMDWTVKRLLRPEGRKRFR